MFIVGNIIGCLFWGVLIALFITAAFLLLCIRFTRTISPLTYVIISILFIFRFFDPGFSCQIAERENNVFNTLYVADVTKRQSIAVLDCDQQFLLKFGWNIDCDKTDVDGADCVLLDKNMFDPKYSGNDFWKFYQTYKTIDWDYLSTMRVIYENDKFILYIK